MGWSFWCSLFRFGCRCKRRYLGVSSEFTENRKQINLSPKNQFFSKPTRESLTKLLSHRQLHKDSNAECKFAENIITNCPMDILWALNQQPNKTDKSLTEGPVSFKTHKTITPKTPLSAFSLCLLTPFRILSNLRAKLECKNTRLWI